MVDSECSSPGTALSPTSYSHKLIIHENEGQVRFVKILQLAMTTLFAMVVLPEAAQVECHNSSGGQLLVCYSPGVPAPCAACGSRCQVNGGVGVDPPLNGHTDIHMYTNSSAYVNQNLECRVSSGQSAFIGVYLINGGECCVSYVPITVHVANSYHSIKCYIQVKSTYLFTTFCIMVNA